MGRLSRTFALIIARRWYVLACYALLLLPSAYFAAKVRQDNSLDRLIIASDPDYIASRDFEKVFGGGEYAVLVAEAEDPFAPAVVRRLDAIERALAKVPLCEVSSALSIFRRARAGFGATPAEIAAFREFASGTRMFDKQGLHGPGFLAMAGWSSTCTTASSARPRSPPSTARSTRPAAARLRSRPSAASARRT